MDKGGFDVRVISEAGTFNVVITQKIESVAGETRVHRFFVQGQMNIPIILQTALVLADEIFVACLHCGVLCLAADEMCVASLQR